MVMSAIHFDSKLTITGESRLRLRLGLSIAQSVTVTRYVTVSSNFLGLRVPSLLTLIYLASSLLQFYILVPTSMASSSSKPDKSSELLFVGQQCHEKTCYTVDFLPFKCQHCSEVSYRMIYIVNMYKYLYISRIVVNTIYLSNIPARNTTQPNMIAWPHHVSQHRFKP